MMSQQLSKILERCGIIWQQHASQPQSNPGPLLWLGRVCESSRIERGLGPLLGPDIWCSEGEWPGLTPADIETWLVDATPGEHLLILHGNKSPLQVSLPFGVEIIYRSDLASMLGEHLLEGGEVGVESFQENISKVSYDPGESAIQLGRNELGLEPKVRPQQILERLGFSGLGLRPVHLQAKLWHLSGCLVGPDGEKEEREWLVLEDPWRQEMVEIIEQDLLDNPPDLQLLENTSTYTDSMAKSKLIALLSQRRTFKLESGGGSVLKRWFAEFKENLTHSRNILVPAWIGDIPGHGESILHGLDASLINLPKTAL